MQGSTTPNDNNQPDVASAIYHPYPSYLGVSLPYTSTGMAIMTMPDCPSAYYVTSMYPHPTGPPVLPPSMSRGGGPSLCYEYMVPANMNMIYPPPPRPPSYDSPPLPPQQQPVVTVSSNSFVDSAVLSPLPPSSIGHHLHHHHHYRNFDPNDPLKRRVGRFQIENASTFVNHPSLSVSADIPLGSGGGGGGTTTLIPGIAPSDIANTNKTSASVVVVAGGGGASVAPHPVSRFRKARMEECGETWEQAGLSLRDWRSKNPEELVIALARQSVTNVNAAGVVCELCKNDQQQQGGGTTFLSGLENGGAAGGVGGQLIFSESNDLSCSMHSLPVVARSSSTSHHSTGPFACVMNCPTTLSDAMITIPPTSPVVFEGETNSLATPTANATASLGMDHHCSVAINNSTTTTTNNNNNNNTPAAVVDNKTVGIMTTNPLFHSQFHPFSSTSSTTIATATSLLPPTLSTSSTIGIALPIAMPMSNVTASHQAVQRLDNSLADSLESVKNNIMDALRKELELVYSQIDFLAHQNALNQRYYQQLFGAVQAHVAPDVLQQILSTQIQAPLNTTTNSMLYPPPPHPHSISSHQPAATFVSSSSSSSVLPQTFSAYDLSSSSIVSTSQSGSPVSLIRLVSTVPQAQQHYHPPPTGVYYTSTQTYPTPSQPPPPTSSTYCME